MVEWQSGRVVESCCAISPALSHCALLQVLARVVGVYLIGSFTPMSRIKQFKHLHACRGPRDLQCIIGWDTRVHSSEFEVKESSLTVGHWFNDGWACDYKSTLTIAPHSLCLVDCPLPAADGSSVLLLGRLPAACC